MANKHEQWHILNVRSMDVHFVFLTKLCQPVAKNETSIPFSLSFPPSRPLSSFSYVSPPEKETFYLHFGASRRSIQFQQTKFGFLKMCKENQFPPNDFLNEMATRSMTF